MWGISSRFPLTNHLAFPGSEAAFGISRDPPMYAHISWPSWIPAKRPPGRLRSLPVGRVPTPSVFLTSKEPSCVCAIEKVSLTPRMRHMWSLSLIWTGLLPMPLLFLLIVYLEAKPAIYPVPVIISIWKLFLSVNL